MKRITIILLFLFLGLILAARESHDIKSLWVWGPYSKEYYGISHIQDLSSGIQVEFCLVAGQYRRNFKVPCALWESGVHPWKVSADMKHICYRHDIEWKDQVYVDAAWHVLDDSKVLLETKCVNNTCLIQNINLQVAVRKAGGTEGQWVPEIQEGEGWFTVKYPEVNASYSVVWDYPLSEVRTWNCARLEELMPSKVHDHVRKNMKGDFKGHFTANFLRPVVLQPQSDTTLWHLIVRLDRDSQAPDPQQLTQSRLRQAEQSDKCKVLGDSKMQITPLGVQLLQATMLTNVVYPINAFGEPIRHFCPGKNWDSLYTWDCGFIGWGMSEIDPFRGYEIIRQYTTTPEEEAPFVHHGTPLATQIFAIGDVWERCGCSEGQLKEIYPRLKRFYDYMTGPRFRRKSGLLETWNLFYNSGGWDDYPPQWALRPQKELRSRTLPMVSTSYYIRCAKILRLLASHLASDTKCKERSAYTADIKQFDSDIKVLSTGILANAWDTQTGWFGYVQHDSEERPTGIYRTDEGVNYNMGLDGVTPLVAGITDEVQTAVLLDHIFTEGDLWSPCGITAVSQKAPYYRIDGYWNGTVWMPHQMILWKTMLDLGLPERAWQIADTALANWERECADSYNCYEHFMIETGRGGGWGNFSGLSSPIINWYNAYHRPGTVSTGFGTLVTGAAWAEDLSSVQLTMEFDKDLIGKEVAVIACLASGPKTVLVKATKKPLTLKI
ncbi:MAG: hypothetical protein J6W82_08370 [Bacteroidales bacterium]|nr:hypothetical protein [Bacteroidales bacterium]